MYAQCSDPGRRDLIQRTTGLCPLPQWPVNATILISGGWLTSQPTSPDDIRTSIRRCPKGGALWGQALFGPESHRRASRLVSTVRLSPSSNETIGR